MCVNKCHNCITSVMGSNCGFVSDPARHTLVSANSGMKLLTGSFSSNAPSSHNMSAAMAVIGFDME
ncbi:unannotated protein [freshwater metagenome]|uniref:Unannotated protein n=1 Tax=freshwater metagenome TaxID=449393 RepID=A0A6J6EXL9_9ZZZZ